MLHPREIARASTKVLEARAYELLNADFGYMRDLEAAQDKAEAASEELEAISDELYRRRHDLEDPSSGLGCHQPS